MFKLSNMYLIVIFIILVIAVDNLSLLTSAGKCEADKYVHGENEIIDQLMLCSLGKSLDLDLTPHGDYMKNTPKTLVDQGLSNKTTILYAKLSGLWTVQRAKFVETGWKCELNKTSVNSVIEFSGLSLEVVEKVDIPLHRNLHKLALHKPCKTFDIPLWMCRQSKPIYRTTKTWVNRAYFNLTLTQEANTKKPIISHLASMFTCPETFKQKITYSSSAIYILSRYAHNSEFQNSSDSHVTKVQNQNKPDPPNESASSVDNSISHPVSYSTTQDGRSPTVPPYHNSVNLIMSQVSEVLRTSLNQCIHIVDSDLSLMVDYNSFNQHRFKEVLDQDKGANKQDGNNNECADKNWLINRIKLAEQTHAIHLSEEQAQDNSHSKRSQFLLKYPVDPNQLLNPYGYYHANADQLIEDS